jgi:hypothetical protein
MINLGKIKKDQSTAKKAEIDLFLLDKAIK